MPENEYTLKNSFRNCNALHVYLSQKARKHNYYKIYTTYCKMIYWVNERALFLSDGTQWNDTKDSASFNNSNSDYYNYGLCFSFSRSENVAMWMLYGGMEHKGVMIDLWRDLVLNIISQTETVDLGFWENNTFKAVMKLNKDYFKLSIIDVLYIAEGQSSNTYDIKRSGETIKNVDKAYVDELNGIKKTYPWNYENECRLILSVPRKLMKDKRLSTAKIPVGDIFIKVNKHNRIYKSPSFVEGSEQTELENSKLRGEMNWDLCDKCPNTVKKHTAL